MLIVHCFLTNVIGEGLKIAWHGSLPRCAAEWVTHVGLQPSCLAPILPAAAAALTNVASAALAHGGGGGGGGGGAAAVLAANGGAARPTRAGAHGAALLSIRLVPCIIVVGRQIDVGAVAARTPAGPRPWRRRLRSLHSASISSSLIRNGGRCIYTIKHIRVAAWESSSTLASRSNCGRPRPHCTKRRTIWLRWFWSSCCVY